MKRFSFWTVIFILITITAIFFYPTALEKKLPVPTDTLIGLYHPWRDLYAETNPRGVPYKNFLITDPIRQQIPWKKEVIDAWKQGKVPALNPYSFGGVPLDANIQAAPFYPFNFLFFVTDFASAWALLIIMQPLLALLFMYLYLSRRNVGTASSLLGATAWAFGGFSIAWLTWGTIIHTALWIPLILFSIDRLASEKKTRISSVLLLVVAGSMLLLAGHIQVALYGGVFAFCYSLLHRKALRTASRYRTLSIAGIAVLLVTLPQWAPLLGFFSQSARGAELASWKNPGWFMPWQHLAQFIAPDFFGNPATLNYWGVWNYGEFIGYMGILPLLFAISAMFLSGLPRFLSFSVIIALLLLLSHPLSRLPYQLQIPVFSVLQPTRLMVLVTLCLSLLSAFGAQQFFSGKSRRMVMSGTILGVVLMLLWGGIVSGLFASLFQVSPENLAVSKRNLYVPTVLYAVGVTLLFLYHRLSHRGVRVFITGIILLVSIADLFRFGWKFTPFTPREYFFPTTKTIEFLSRQPKPFRVMSLDDRILPPNVSGYYGIESLEGYDPVAPLRYDRFLSTIELGAYRPDLTSGFHRIYTTHTIDATLLRYFNVRFVLSLSEVKKPFLQEVFREGETRVYEYANSLPRVYLAEQVTGAKSEDVLPLLMKSATDRVAVYDGSEGILSAPMSGEEMAVIKNYRADEMTVRTKTVNKRMLVILNGYDKRWSATMEDGKKLRVYRVNYLFMGVTVPEGDHQITVSFH